MINKITAEDARVVTDKHLKMIKLFDLIRHISALGFYYIITELTAEEIASFKSLGYHTDLIANSNGIKVSWEDRSNDKT